MVTNDAWRWPSLFQNWHLRLVVLFWTCSSTPLLFFRAIDFIWTKLRKISDMTMYLGQEKWVRFHPVGVGERNGELKTNNSKPVEVRQCVAVRECEGAPDENSQAIQVRKKNKGPVPLWRLFQSLIFWLICIQSIFVQIHLNPNIDISINLKFELYSSLVYFKLT